MEQFKSFEPSKCHLGVKFGKVGGQVIQVKDQVGQGQGQELVNICGRILVDRKESFKKWKKLSELFHKD